MQTLWFKNGRILLSLQIDFFSVLVQTRSQFVNIEFSVLENEDNPVSIQAASKSSFFLICLRRKCYNSPTIYMLDIREGRNNNKESLKIPKG